MVTVRAASSRDSGNYTCLATNVYGSDSRTASVTVVMPSTTVVVSRLTSTSITLVWKNVEHSRAYRLSYGPLSSSNRSLEDWSPSGGNVDILYYMRSYTFAELQPDTAYRFCISIRPTFAGYDVTSGESKDGGRSPWTVDCAEATTLAAHDVSAGLTDVRRYVISGCAVTVGVALLVCVVGARRLCGWEGNRRSDVRCCASSAHDGCAAGKVTVGLTDVRCCASSARDGCAAGKVTVGLTCDVVRRRHTTAVRLGR